MFGGAPFNSHALKHKKKSPSLDSIWYKLIDMLIREIFEGCIYGIVLDNFIFKLVGIPYYQIAPKFNTVNIGMHLVLT